MKKINLFFVVFLGIIFSVNHLAAVEKRIRDVEGSQKESFQEKIKTFFTKTIPNIFKKKPTTQKEELPKKTVSSVEQPPKFSDISVTPKSSTPPAKPLPTPPAKPLPTPPAKPLPTPIKKTQPAPTSSQKEFPTSEFLASKPSESSTPQKAPLEESKQLLSAAKNWYPTGSGFTQKATELSEIERKLKTATPNTPGYRELQQAKILMHVKIAEGGISRIQDTSGTYKGTTDWDKVFAGAAAVKSIEYLRTGLTVKVKKV